MLQRGFAEEALSVIVRSHHHCSLRSKGSRPRFTLAAGDSSIATPRRQLTSLRRLVQEPGAVFGWATDAQFIPPHVQPMS
jgi:hypothetical protein